MSLARSEIKRAIRPLFVAHPELFVASVASFVTTSRVGARSTTGAHTTSIIEKSKNSEPGMKTPLILRYFIWSMLIFAVSMGLLSTRGLRSFELRSLDFFPSRNYGPYSKYLKETDIPVVLLPIYGQISPDLYLEVVRDAVRHLKKAGAKVVIVPVPEYLQPSVKIMKSIREIVRDSIVVFAVSGPMNSQFMFDRDPTLEDRNNWWVRHPLYHRVDVPWGVMSQYTKHLSILTRFVPTGFRDFDTGEPVPDIALLALKRYFDIPDKAETQLISSRVPIGPYAFQIERDGLSYVRYRSTQRRWIEIYPSIQPASDSVEYFPARDTKQPRGVAIDSAWQAHRGKIVFIDWSSSAGYRYPSPAIAYMRVFDALFNRSFVKVHNEWNVLLITTLVILLSVFSYTVRNGLTVFVSLVLAVASVAVSIWLFKTHDVLFEPIYIIVPILLCGFILPVVKVAGEKRLAEEKVKSLEEENRRLVELQRSTPPENHS
ncbi:MAG: hypothetical protein HW389_2065 [Bacteroidetes bacterium]|nr:hypothetical protein [Bacteroidota bacterium]